MPLCGNEDVKATHKPCQYGIACSFGDEKIAYSLRLCIEKHWMDNDFGILNFPELLPW